MKPVGNFSNPYAYYRGQGSSGSPTSGTSPDASPAHSQGASSHPTLSRSKAHKYEGSPDDGTLRPRRMLPPTSFTADTVGGSGLATRVKTSSSDAEAINRHAQRLLEIHGRTLPPDVQAGLLAGIYYESKEVHKGLFQRARTAQKEANIRMGKAVLETYQTMVEEGHKPFKERKNYVQLSDR
ncbi:hypothetical protein QRO11_01995 [Paracidovorax citrulli]|nr:hypothetical protein [Paracidovorax citrulli]PVY64430.1 hypothetical protein C8E08_1750 [Paracidovorax citrulli]QCX10339.1 hypothetical protein APS58_1448 [Paracidovorax citrulli]REG71370.1 hypothetical protein C8E07_4618 [Paracidovorax citrulli]RLJ95923.1 hypothetical protein C8E06_4613 [Paracidovorax citrulli]UEG46671.1 hypothetical protein LKW27_01985 [Paracidovorax citrulli]